jgi:hypothetical protein
VDISLEFIEPAFDCAEGALKATGSSQESVSKLYQFSACRMKPRGSGEERHISFFDAYIAV